MDVLNIIFGVVTIISGGITVFQYIQYEKNKANEKIKLEVLKSQLNSIHNSLIPIHYSIGRIRKWISESEEVDSYAIYRNLRTIEVQIESSIIPIQQEVEKIKNWQYGTFTPSNFEPKDYNLENK